MSVEIYKAISNVVDVLKKDSHLDVHIVEAFLDGLPDQIKASMLQGLFKQPKKEYPQQYIIRINRAHPGYILDDIEVLLQYSNLNYEDANAVYDKLLKGESYLLPTVYTTLVDAEIQSNCIVRTTSFVTQIEDLYGNQI